MVITNVQVSVGSSTACQRRAPGWVPKQAAYRLGRVEENGTNAVILSPNIQEKSWKEKDSYCISGVGVQCSGGGNKGGF